MSALRKLLNADRRAGMKRFGWRILLDVERRTFETP